MIQPDRLLENFLSILRINSYYPNEDPVADVLRSKLEPVGVQLTKDEHRNMLGYLPGSGSLAAHDPVLLCAHMDTVQPTEGMEPVIRDGAVHTDGTSVLGADDKAGVSALVEAVQAIADAGLPHPPVELLFTVGEDIAHIGSKAFDVAPVRSSMAFVVDAGGPVGKIVLAQAWSQNIQVTFHGRAAHAGTAPENGRSAVVMLGQAIHGMQLGRIDEETTANVGKLWGGEAPNIIPPQAELIIQVRSLNRDKQRRHMKNLLACCQRAAADWDGTMEQQVIYEMKGYRFAASDAIVRRAESAIRSVGLEPEHSVTCGGSDANEFNEKGLSSVVLTVGFQDIHTNTESMPIDELNRITEVCVALMLAR